MRMLGTFAERATISEHSAIKVDPDLPLDKVVLIGCCGGSRTSRPPSTRALS